MCLQPFVLGKNHGFVVGKVIHVLFHKWAMLTSGRIRQLCCDTTSNMATLLGHSHEPFLFLLPPGFVANLAVSFILVTNLCFFSFFKFDIFVYIVTFARVLLDDYQLPYYLYFPEIFCFLLNCLY